MNAHRHHLIFEVRRRWVDMSISTQRLFIMINNFSTADVLTWIPIILTVHLLIEVTSEVVFSEINTQAYWSLQQRVKMCIRLSTLFIIYIVINMGLDLI